MALEMSSQVPRLEDFITIINIFPCDRKILKLLTTRMNYLSKYLYLYTEEILKIISLANLPYLI